LSRDCEEFLTLRAVLVGMLVDGRNGKPAPHGEPAV
jgi:hypothetical protein